MDGEENRVRGIVKGVMFEQIVRILLNKSYYLDLEVEPGRVHFTDGHGWKIRGRGEWHQIDAIGRYEFNIPFIYPIRLIAEAKFYTKPVGLPEVRNFLGVVKDISENYFSIEGKNIGDLSTRYTECGAMFSAEGFRKPAQRFAYAHGIYLVSYKSHPIIRKIKSRLNKLELILRCTDVISRKGEFQKIFSECVLHPRRCEHREMPDYITDMNEWQRMIQSLSGVLNSINTSLLGLASGIYPLHLMSYDSIPHHLFTESDSISCKIRWKRKTPFAFTIEAPSDEPVWHLEFSAPQNVRDIIGNHPIVKKEVRKAKVKYFPFVDIPLRSRKKRRIIRLNLDMNWLKKSLKVPKP